MTGDRQDARLLEVRGLTKIFGTLKACDHVDLTIGKGEIHALLGENGAGKSTLVKMLFGSLEPASGEIVWKGRDIRGCTTYCVLRTSRWRSRRNADSDRTVDQ